VTFWDHLEELRGSIFRCLLVILIFACLAFVFKDEVFAVVLAPKDENVKLINTGLATQFVTHVSVSIYAGLIAAMPYILFQLFRFVSPALYESEKTIALRVVTSGYLLFMSGVAFSYFVVFPITFRFLGNYQVDTSIENMISLESYIDTLLMLSVMIGIVFEIPIVSWMLGKMGLLTRGMMTEYRRHAIVAILIIAAFITPTSDAFTLAVVSIPMYLLYEISILLVKK